MEFVLLLTAALFGIPVPEDVAMLTLAVQTGRGVLAFPVTFCLSWAVLMFSDTLQFTLGKTLGPRLINFLTKKRILNNERRTKIENRLKRWGLLACFIARFIPGGRIPVFVLAGNSGINLPAFLLVDILSTAIDVSFWLLGSHYFDHLVRIFTNS